MKKIYKDHADKVVMDSVQFAFYMTICKILGIFKPEDGEADDSSPTDQT